MHLPFKVSALHKNFEELSLDDFNNGTVLLLDKPLTWTSFQAVNKLKYYILKKFGIKKIKIGHAGTLDPLATGLLIICTGKETKNIHIYQGQKKEYTGTFCLGATTPTYDLESEIDAHFPTQHNTTDLINEVKNSFVGEITQTPPSHSAVKVNGVRAYKTARQGIEVEIPSRTITIYDFEISNYNLPNIDFKVTCSKGTYIRTLANDFGKKLQSGAHLSQLRRTKIGDFSL